MTTIELVNSAIARGWISFPKPSPHKGRTAKILSPEQIVNLKRMRKEGASLNDCAKLFGVSRTTIHHTMEGRK